MKINDFYSLSQKRLYSLFKLIDNITSISYLFMFISILVTIFIPAIRNSEIEYFDIAYESLILTLWMYYIFMNIYYNKSYRELSAYVENKPELFKNEYLYISEYDFNNLTKEKNDYWEITVE